MTDWEFVFDGVVGYLQSPIWNIPIITFIEKNCIVFEPNEENELTYTEIHKAYSDLVEELLSSYLKDVGITEEQFVHACDAGSNESATAANRSIFEQVWAAEDFELFKKIMIQKNIDMELQVLNMIQQRNGTIPPAFDQAKKGGEKPRKKSSSENKDKLMKEVMRQSEIEYDKERKKMKDIEKIEKRMACMSKEESARLHELATRELEDLERMVSLSLRLEKRQASEKEAAAMERKKTRTPESKTKPSSSSSKSKESSAKGKPSSKSSGKESPKSGKESPKSGKESPKHTTDVTPAKQATSKQKSEKLPSKLEDSSPKTETPRKSSPVNQKVAESSAKQKPELKPLKKVPPKSPVTATAGSSELALGSSKKPSSPPSPASSQPKVDMTPSQAANSWLLSAKAESGSGLSGDSFAGVKGGPSREDELQRANHMRKLREQLQERKRKERAKYFQSDESEQLTTQRPKSSLAARRRVVSTEPGTEATTQPAAQVVDENIIAARKALAVKLRQVINESSLGAPSSSEH